MKPPGRVARLLFFCWMTLVVSIFIVVTVPAEGRLLLVLPKLFWQLRGVIYPLFYSPSIL